ncbi:uncharacterized protein EI97DRAFT_246041 [Westerdykella ornata]|uniref:Uncharacterized protein n=1 Tax=Westerdykella ornata TaxID=318751 RepID=A0A6A6JT24_WESOR|nr:uncharacterized protein EI97DRAFT_246041 [Westerdykella ornata]KAF2278139.1 hypothetical protein EI97DRAFT_246041 [Westerdykella ornata]
MAGIFRGGMAEECGWEMRRGDGIDERKSSKAALGESRSGSHTPYTSQASGIAPLRNPSFTESHLYDALLAALRRRRLVTAGIKSRPGKPAHTDTCVLICLSVFPRRPAHTAHLPRTRPPVDHAPAWDSRATTRKFPVVPGDRPCWVLAQLLCLLGSPVPVSWTLQWMDRFLRRHSFLRSGWSPSQLRQCRTFRDGSKESPPDALSSIICAFRHEVLHQVRPPWCGLFSWLEPLKYARRI